MGCKQSNPENAVMKNEEVNGINTRNASIIADMPRIFVISSNVLKKVWPPKSDLTVAALV